MATEKILVVDDEALIVELYRLQLTAEFQIDIATSGQQAISLLSECGPYAIVVSDMHMPGMSGAQLLRSVQESYPKTVRIMLTGDDQQTVAVDAVNEGQIFRFLNKPCPPDRLAKALRDGLEQYRLVMAEKDLLSNTLNGSINLLVEILSIANPLAFGRATRVHQLVQKMCHRLHVANSWEITIAATLSQIGCVALSDAVLDKLQRGGTLTPDEAKCYASHPQLGHDLVCKIPRLQRIAEIIARQQQPQAGDKLSGDDTEYREVATRAGFLKVALDYDGLIEQGIFPQQALNTLRRRSAAYPRRVLQTLSEIVDEERGRHVLEISLDDLRAGMVLEEHLLDESGLLLIAKGQEITQWILERLRQRRATRKLAIREPIYVLQMEPLEDSRERSSSQLLPLSITA